MFKQKLYKLVLAFGLLLSLGAPALPVSAAGGGSISLTANKSTIASGATVIVGVYMNAGGNAINAVQTDISYPSSKLQYVGFSATGTAFEISATNGGSDGLASVARGTTSSVSGSALVGTMTFRALVGSGSAAIGVAGSSSLVSDGNPVAYSSSGVTVNFGAATAASAASTPAAAAKAATPAPPKDTTPPTITEVKATNVTPFSTTITWVTSEASDSAVEFGLDDKYGLSSSSSTQGTTHSVALNNAFLTPQTLLHYRVKSADGAGNVATGTDQTLQLPGVTVTVVVRGPDGRPQAGATVTLDGSSGVTDNKGSVTLKSGLGDKKITSIFQGQTVQQPITVAKSPKPLPPVQLDFAKQPVNRWMLVSAGLLVAVITLLAIDGFLFGSRMLARLAGLKIRKAKPALAAVPVAEDKPDTTTPILKHHAELTPVEPALPQPEPAVEEKVADIMEETPVPDPTPANKPIEITTPPDSPLAINLQPLEEPAQHVLPTAPELPTVPVTAPDPVAEVAERLKKPAAKKKAAPTKAAKPKTAAKKITVA